ncbi:FAD-binding protein [Actinoplanes sp. NPDC026619]|uniref:FAD-binding protein n=1 Tax=Actinoplanes sp. NPDC026619 TaxID=3155798 RepID=UPI003410983C
MHDHLQSGHEFDVVVVGAGPAGLFAALRAQRVPGIRMLVVDAGLDLTDRLDAQQSRPGDNAIITMGFGGAGLFSDGKLCLSHRIGSTLAHRFPANEVEERQHAIDELIRGGEDAPLLGADVDAAAALERGAAAVGMEFLHYPLRHVGSDQLPRMLSRLRARLGPDVDVRCRTEAVEITESSLPGSRWTVRLHRAGDLPTAVYAQHVVLAPGKVGSAWMDRVGAELDLRRHPACPKLGFRLEGRKDFLDPLLSVAGDPKLIWRAGSGAEVRTHCVCYGGDVVPAGYEGLLLVGGHADSGHAADRSNTAVIATAGKDLPLTSSEARGVVATINGRYGGLVAQSLGDFLAGVPSRQSVAGLAAAFTPSMPAVAPGDLAAALPAPITGLLRRFIERLAGLCPQALDPTNVLYGPAVERWAARFAVSDAMETDRPGLYLAGDGPGLTGGIIGAAESGWLAGDNIAGRLTAAVSAP